MNTSLSKILSDIKSGNAQYNFKNIEALKKGFAAYKKGGGDTGKASGVISILNQIPHAKDDNPGRMTTVQEFESKVV
jgi:hypothetical protein